MAWLAKAGYAVLRFYYRGVRDSEGADYRLIPDEMIEDIRCAITFLQQQPEVDPLRIGLWGATTGGANVSYVAGVDSRVKCMVSVSGLGDCGRWQRGARRYWEWVELLKQLDEDKVKRVMTGKSALVNISSITGHERNNAEFHQKLKQLYPDYQTSERLISLESVEALLQFKPETVVAGITPRAAMWIRAGNDALVPIEESQRMYDRAGEPKKLVTIEGKAHEELYFDDGFEMVMRHSTDWFNEHL